MIGIITNDDEKVATEKELRQYYETVKNKINVLLEKYAVRDSENQLQKININDLICLLTSRNFFSDTPLKPIFIGNKNTFIPDEIVRAYQDIISNAPVSIKTIYLNTFLHYFRETGWNIVLRHYFETTYHLASQTVIILKDIQDLSLMTGVYQLTFHLQTSPEESASVILKCIEAVTSWNELVYFQLQKEFYANLNDKQMPKPLFYEGSKATLLLSPRLPGISSDLTLSFFIRAYRKTNSLVLLEALKVMLEAFMRHAALGDVLGRNDRHLLNSLIIFTQNQKTPENLLDNLLDSMKIIDCAKHIVSEPSKAFSLIDIDLKWLLGEKNAHWALIDIDFGLSEINLLSLLPEFNDYKPQSNLFEQRRKTLKHYFDIYCEQLDIILAKKESLFSAIKKYYPNSLAEKKINLLMQRINILENGREAIIEIFERYLLNFRRRMVYRTTLFELHHLACRSKNAELQKNLDETGLTNYLPSIPNFTLDNASVFLQLQCFRGVLAERDKLKLSEPTKISWEVVASTIDKLAEKFQPSLWKDLQKKMQFIETDTVDLLQYLQHPPAVECRLGFS